MKNQIWKFGSLFAAGAIGALANVSDVGAANINTHAADFHAYNFPSEHADFDYVSSGVYNINASARSAIGSVPRSPLPAGATSGGFYVDGTNASGKTTSGTISSYNYNGTFLGSASFTVTAAGYYDQYVSLPAAQLPTYAYTTLYISLPGGGSSSKLLGVTSLQ